MSNNFQPQEKQIGEHTFIVAPFTAIEALKIKTFLMRHLAPALGRIIGSLNTDNNKSILDTDIDSEKIGSALESLLANLTDDEFISFIKRALARTQAKIQTDGNPKLFAFAPFDERIFDLVFKQKLMSLYKLIFFVLEVNYPDFFDKMGGIGSMFKTLMPKGQDESTKSSLRK